MKILITGAAGFIGFHSVKKMIAEGHEVIGIDNINDYYSPSLKYGRLAECGIEKKDLKWYRKTKSIKFGNYYFIRLNLEDKQELFELFRQENFDYVINLAAQAGVRYSIENPEVYMSSNITGFFNILEACRKYPPKHLIYASSSSVYGLNSKIPFSTTDSAAHQISLYAATKKSNELLAHTYSHLYKIPTTGLRFFTVYGPWGRPDMAYFLFAEAMFKNEKIKVFNNGEMSRDFTYISDIVNGINLVMNHVPKSNDSWDSKLPLNDSSSAAYKIYNIGNNSPVNLLEFIETLERSFDKVAKKVFMPMQAGDVKSTYADVNSLINDTGYKPSVDLKEGIGHFADWYLKYFYK